MLGLGVKARHGIGRLAPLTRAFPLLKPEKERPMPSEANARKKSLTEMRKSALGLIKLIERQIEEPSGNWHEVEVALLEIRDHWEDAKACEIGTAIDKLGGRG